MLKQWNDWQPGQRLAINRIMWDDAERSAVNDVFDRDYFAAGHYVREMQRALEKWAGGGRFLLTNSGSSALLIALQALIEDGRLHKGDYVLHPTLTFNTSAAVIVQAGLKPVFVDVAEGTYNIDPNLAAAALADLPQIKAALIPYLIGNTTDLDMLESALGDERWLIGDSCDTMGTKWGGFEVGSIADLTAYSGYGSHHMTFGGVGGALRFNEFLGSARIYELARSMIHWGRDFEAANGDAMRDFVNRYTYIVLGYDFQMTEMQAAFGYAQLPKLERWNARRSEVFAQLYQFMQRYEEFFVLPYSYLRCTPSWFGFPLTVRDEAPFERDALCEKLLAAKIELRPLFSGNTLKQKAWEGVDYIQYRETRNADRCMTSAFFIPAWPMSDNALNYLMQEFSFAMQGVMK